MRVTNSMWEEVDRSMRYRDYLEGLPDLRAVDTAGRMAGLVGLMPTRKDALLVEGRVRDQRAISLD